MPSGISGWNDGALDDARERAGKGLAAAAIYLSGRIKEAISIPAPRRKVLGANGIVRYAASTKATPGAPPRKLSGQLRRTITWQWMEKLIRARVGTNIKYARPLETWMGHPFIVPTMNREKHALRIIMGRNWG